MLFLYFFLPSSNILWAHFDLGGASKELDLIEGVLDVFGASSGLEAHGHKTAPKTTSRICGNIGERAQVILVWMRACSIGYTTHKKKELGGYAHEF